MSTNREPKAQVPAPAPAPEVEIPLAEESAKPVKSSGKINVVALRAGFFKGSRKQAGDKFTLDSEVEFGTWMKKI